MVTTELACTSIGLGRRKIAASASMTSPAIIQGPQRRGFVALPALLPRSIFSCFSVEVVDVVDAEELMGF